MLGSYKGKNVRASATVTFPAPECFLFQHTGFYFRSCSAVFVLAPTLSHRLYLSSSPTALSAAPAVDAEHPEVFISDPASAPGSLFCLSTATTFISPPAPRSVFQASPNRFFYFSSTIRVSAPAQHRLPPTFTNTSMRSQPYSRYPSLSNTALQ